MTITVAIIIGLLISFIAIYSILNPYLYRTKIKKEHQDLMDSIQARIAKANAASGDQFSLENQSKATKDLYKNAQFINKQCTHLDDFIINDQINEFDLRKLADLNGIQLQISEGWYPLVINLIKELYENGWDKRVTCIKEKYASLRFYTDHRYGDTIYNIIEHYEKKSEHVCETCGERGEIRYQSSWHYVACRKHYLEDLGKIAVEASGFRLDENFYPWSDVTEAYFEDLDYYKKYKFLKLEFKKANIQHRGWIDNKLLISKYTIGYGNFLNHMPRTFERLDLDYLKNFENPEYCEICGYQAVYFGTCECCENDTWESYSQKWNSPKADDEKAFYLKHNQISWAEDEGELYEFQQKNYSKNPDFKILYTEQEKEDYLKDEE